MSTTVSALPRCVALRSKHDNSYLRSVHEENHGSSVIELGGDGGGVMDPRCRFYLEPSEEHEGLVHVRCCYNNKYWVPQQRVLHGGSARWVIDTAHEPEEDLSKPSCTLHKLSPIAGERGEEDGSTCRLLHSKLVGKYACVSSTPLMCTRSYLHIASHEEAGRLEGGLIDAFTVIDVTRQKQLPSTLAFKGDNGHFLELYPITENLGLPGFRYSLVKDFHYLKFSGNEIGDARVLHTIFTNHDGVVRIQNNYSGLFWRNGKRSWTFADSNDTTHNNPDTLFTVTSGDDFIALKNLGTNYFCKRLTAAGKTDCLADADASITDCSKLQCHEPVLSRLIEDVDFRLSEARMYTTGVDGLHSETVENNSSTTNKSTLTFTYTNTVTTSWSSTVSLKTNVKTTLVTKLPCIVEGKIELSTELSGSYTWGKTETKTEQVSKQLTFDIPPKKKVAVKAIGSNGVCNIPFSYKQKDVLTNGLEVYEDFTDGMYFGVKTSDIKFKTIEEPLS